VLAINNTISLREVVLKGRAKDSSRQLQPKLGSPRQAKVLAQGGQDLTGSAVELVDG
jgi:hypothetical protein